MTHVLEVRGLVKRYGRKEALKGVSFSVSRGEIYGLIGPNGAGKTTTLRIIATLLRPSGGEVNVNGIDVVKHPDKVRRLISYLPEEAGAYPGMTGIEYLRFIAKIYYDDPEEAEKAVEEGAKITGLGEALYERTKTYSKGMKRRLQLARALMVSPLLALLDEPTSGIDLVHSLHLRKTIKRYAVEHGTAIVMSSHNLFEVQTICDRIGIISQGRIVAEGPVKELLSRYGVSDLENLFSRVVAG